MHLFFIHQVLKLLSCFVAFFRKSLGLLEENYNIFLSLWFTCLVQRQSVFGIEKISAREDITYTHILLPIHIFFLLAV